MRCCTSSPPARLPTCPGAQLPLLDRAAQRLLHGGAAFEGLRQEMAAFRAACPWVEQSALFRCGGCWFGLNFVFAWHAMQGVPGLLTVLSLQWWLHCLTSAAVACRLLLFFAAAAVSLRSSRGWWVRRGGTGRRMCGTETPLPWPSE